jgi:stearoyl-CoA desaturase (delta-9 desaturase)
MNEACSVTESAVLPLEPLEWADRVQAPASDTEHGKQIDWLRVTPFLGMHLACFAAFWVGFSATAAAVAAGLYFARMFAITAFYHRYFSHRTFKTTRTVQFLMAIAGCTAVQRGPLWWAAHHRHHHLHSDEHPDVHSPLRRGFWIAHMGWFMTRGAFTTQDRLVRDWVRYPELVWLNRLDWLPGVLLAAATFGLGAGLERWVPQLGTNGLQMLVWGFFISTVVCYHATYTINSLAHAIGRQRFATGDDSRNSFLLALLTLGEGWHNNHHRYPAAARQGFYWWEFDPTYYLLRAATWTGLIWDLREVPRKVLDEGRRVA